MKNVLFSWANYAICGSGAVVANFAVARAHAASGTTYTLRAWRRSHDSDDLRGGCHTHAVYVELHFRGRVHAKQEVVAAVVARPHVLGSIPLGAAASAAGCRALGIRSDFLQWRGSAARRVGRSAGAGYDGRA
jgi:hypothetical protein